MIIGLNEATNDIVQHAKTTDDNDEISKHLDHKNSKVRVAAAKNHNISGKNLHKALNHSDIYVREAAIKNPNITSDHLHKALDDKHGYITAKAASHPKATKANLEKAVSIKGDTQLIATRRLGTKDYVD